jgi:hypothetical protein
VTEAEEESHYYYADRIQIESSRIDRGGERKKKSWPYFVVMSDGRPTSEDRPSTQDDSRATK